MSDAMTAWIVEPTVWIPSGQDRAIPSRFRVATTLRGFIITLLAVVGERGPRAVEVTVQQPLPEGDPVTMTVLRTITVDGIIRDGLEQLSRPLISAEAETGMPGAFRVEAGGEVYIGQPVPGTGRGRDTTDARLAQVADVYLRALAKGRPPVKAVTEDLHFARSTAGRLVGQARKAGLLDETTPGKRGALGDFRRLVRSLQEAGGEVQIAPGSERKEE